MSIIRGLFLCIALILLLAASSVFAQTANVPLEIIQKKWHFVVRNPALEEDAFRANNQINQAQSTPITDAKQSDNKLLPVDYSRPVKDLNVASASTMYVYEIKVKNTGRQKIQSINWDYVFFDPATKAEIGRRRFLSRSTIAAGKTKNITIRAVAPPTQVVNVSQTDKLNNKYSEQIIIRKIVYQDGTVWNLS